MYSPSLQHLLVQSRVHDLYRSRQTRNAQPITTMGRTASRKRRRLRLSVYLARASERFVGHPTPAAFAF